MSQQPLEPIRTIASTSPNTDTMEVHHHPDMHHKKKKWTEYILAFVMIFLAVTLGFFAESLREHLGEKERAKQYAQSMAADFTADTLLLQQLVTYSALKIKNIDSLEESFRAQRSRTNDSILYTRALYLISTSQFDDINGTYQQILDAGSLRFFDQELVNNLNGFDATALKLRLMEEWENKFLYEKVNPQAQQMFNYKVFDDLRASTSIGHKMYLHKADNDDVDIVLNRASLIKHLRERQLVQHQALLDKADKILERLHQQYP
jgi:hypothetical protein